MSRRAWEPRGRRREGSAVWGRHCSAGRERGRRARGGGCGVRARARVWTAASREHCPSAAVLHRTRIEPTQLRLKQGSPACDGAQGGPGDAKSRGDPQAETSPPDVEVPTSPMNPVWVGEHARTSVYVCLGAACLQGARGRQPRVTAVGAAGAPGSLFSPG